MGRCRGRPGQEGKIAERIERALQADIGQPSGGDADGRPLGHQDSRDEGEAGPASDPHRLGLSDQRHRGLSGENQRGIGETSTERDQECGGAITTALVFAVLGSGRAGNHDAAGDDHRHGRPLRRARPHPHGNICREHESRMRRHDRSDHRDRPARQARVKQRAHQRHEETVGHGDRAAEWRPDERRPADEHPQRRSQRADQEHAAIGQRRAQRTRAEARHEVGDAETQGGRETEQRRHHVPSSLPPRSPSARAGHPIWIAPAPTRSSAAEFATRGRP